MIARIIVRTIFRLRTNKRFLSNTVGTGVLDGPFRYESNFFPRRTVEDACPYNKRGGFGASPLCFVLTVCFRRAIRESPLRFNNGMRFAAIVFDSRRLFFSGRRGRRPLQKQQDLIGACRGDHILAKQVCHEAKRNIESPA